MLKCAWPAQHKGVLYSVGNGFYWKFSGLKNFWCTQENQHFSHCRYIGRWTISTEISSKHRANIECGWYMGLYLHHGHWMSWPQVLWVIHLGGMHAALAAFTFCMVLQQSYTSGATCMSVCCLPESEVKYWASYQWMSNSQCANWENYSCKIPRIGVQNWHWYCWCNVTCDRAEAYE